MDFAYTKEQDTLRKEVAAFAKAEAAKPERKIEEKDSIFPSILYRKLAKKGWAGQTIPTAYGGQGKGAIEYSIIMEELSKELLITPQTVVQTAKSILSHGNEEQKKKYLPKLASGEYISAQAISEPGMGSSFKNMKTTAKKDGNYYVIKGRKTHINLAKESGVFHLLTVSDKGLTSFLIEKDTPGIRFEKGDPIALRTSPIYDIHIDCRISEEQLLGKEGEGLAVFLATFNLSRIGNCAQLIGYTSGCLEEAVRYAKNREIGDKSVTDFQGIQWIVAEIIAEREAARLATAKAAWAEDNGLEHGLETSIARYLAAQAAEKAINRAFSLVGSYACYYDVRFEQYLREIKSSQVAGGSTEIMRNNIWRQSSHLF